jgi:hypothetical protein
MSTTVLNYFISRRLDDDPGFFAANLAKQHGLAIPAEVTTRGALREHVSSFKARPRPGLFRQAWRDTAAYAAKNHFWAAAAPTLTAVGAGLIAGMNGWQPRDLTFAGAATMVALTGAPLKRALKYLPYVLFCRHKMSYAEYLSYLFREEGEAMCPAPLSPPNVLFNTMTMAAMGIVAVYTNTLVHTYPDGFGWMNGAAAFTGLIALNLAPVASHFVRTWQGLTRERETQSALAKFSQQVDENGGDGYLIEHLDVARDILNDVLVCLDQRIAQTKNELAAVQQRRRANAEFYRGVLRAARGPSEGVSSQCNIEKGAYHRITQVLAQDVLRPLQDMAIKVRHLRDKIHIALGEDVEIVVPPAHPAAPQFQDAVRRNLELNQLMLARVDSNVGAKAVLTGDLFVALRKIVESMGQMEMAARETEQE